MKFKRVNIQDITNAVNEYENTYLTYDEICMKYKINKSMLYYHLRKHRMNNQNGGNVNIKPSVICNLPDEPIDNVSLESDKTVFINTNNKKMNAYMAQHNINKNKEPQESLKEKKRTRISDADLDKLFQSLNN